MKKENLNKITALLVHVAKVDEIYTEKEKKIIKNFIDKFILLLRLKIFYMKLNN